MKFLRSYAFSLLLLGSIVVGALVGSFAPATAATIRPIGSLFLNLIFVVLVPLVFFTVSSSIASAGASTKLTRVSLCMLAVFVAMSAIAAIGALVFMLFVSPIPVGTIQLKLQPRPEVPSLLEQMVRSVTVADFPELLSKSNLLPLILVAIATG